MSSNTQGWTRYIKYHVFYWIGFVLFFTWIWGTYDQDYFRNLAIQIWSLPARMVLVYVTLGVLLPQLFEKEKYLLFTLCTFLLLIAVSVLIQRPVMFFIVEGRYLPYHSEAFFNVSQLTNTGIDVGLAAVLPLGFTFFRYWKNSREQIEKLAQLAERASHSHSNDLIQVKAGNVNHRINSSDILYIESLRNYLRIRTVEKELVPYGSISEMESRLDNNQFLRVHRSYIVNLAHMNAFTSNSVEIGDKSIPIGRKYKAQLFERMKAV